VIAGLNGADQVTFTVVGLVIFIALVVVWRVAVHDRSISRIRFGVFYEREREKDDDARDEQQQQGDT
jgi:hypothetical protein